MAFQGKVIENKATRQVLKFETTARDSDGKILIIESIYNTRSNEPPPHFHPEQDEHFEVMKGEIKVRLNDRIEILKAGQYIEIQRNQVHAMWNNTDQQTVVKWTTQPALRTEYFLENMCGLSQDERVNEQGVPGILQIALLTMEFSHEFRLAKPPYWIQKTLSAVLVPFARLSGLQSTYEKYID